MEWSLNDVSEIREQRRKDFLEKKRRQLLIERNEELREIEKHLRAAYVSKTLDEQRAQIKEQQEKERRLKEQECLEIEEQLKRHQETLRQQELKEQQKKDAFRKILKDQVTESLNRRQEQIEEMVSDRESMEQLLARLKIEQKKEKEELEARRLSMKQELDNFMREQQEHKLKQQMLDEQDRKRADEIQRQRDEEKRRAEEMMLATRKQQLALSEQLGQDLHKTEMEKQRRENVLLELLVEERKAKEDYRFRQLLEQQVRARDNVRLDLERFIELHKLQRETEKRNKLAEEKAEMARIIAETQRKDELEIQRLRAKEQEYNRAIQEMLQERRNQRATDTAAHLRDYELLLNEERSMQNQIDEERMRLLCKHPSDILRYLPSGVLRETDREFLALPPPPPPKK